MRGAISGALQKKLRLEIVSEAVEGPGGSIASAASRHETTAEVEREIAALDALDIIALQNRWRELFRSTRRSRSLGVLGRAIAYRLQELVYGGLKPAVRRQQRCPPRRLGRDDWARVAQTARQFPHVAPVSRSRLARG